MGFAQEILYRVPAHMEAKPIFHSHQYQHCQGDNREAFLPPPLCMHSHGSLASLTPIINYQIHGWVGFMNIFPMYIYNFSKVHSGLD